MNLPGIQSRALDSGGGGSTWGERFAEEESRPRQQPRAGAMRPDEAGALATTAQIAHAQGAHKYHGDRPASVQEYNDNNQKGVSRGEGDSGGEVSPSSARSKRNKPVKWSVEEDRRLRDAVSKVRMESQCVFFGVETIYKYKMSTWACVRTAVQCQATGLSLFSQPV